MAKKQQSSPQEHPTVRPNARNVPGNENPNSVSGRFAAFREQVAANNDHEASLVQFNKLLAQELRDAAADPKRIAEIADRLEQDSKPLTEAVFANSDLSPRHADGTRPDHTTGIDTLHSAGSDAPDGLGKPPVAEVNDVINNDRERE